MLLAISTTHRPATDLGYLLHKSPERAQATELTFGMAHVLYPEASDERCTVVLAVEVDPVGLVRGRARGEAGIVRQYVNDRPYATSSLLSTAISRVFGTALGGRSKGRQELADTAIPLEAHLPAVSCRGGAELVRSLFEPLGYAVTLTPVALDPAFPAWGESRYFDLRLAATARLADLLTHLYVLLPVLDGDKHYWIGADEVEKLLAKGEGWLESHPARETIVRRYLRRKARYVREALERLADVEGVTDLDEGDDDRPETGAGEDAIERPMSLNEQRLGSVMAVLKASGARRVVDLGCGEGKLLLRLARDDAFEQVLGLDVTYRSVMAARAELGRLPDRVQQRADVVQGSLTYGDDRLSGWDAATLVEVIEHLEPGRLPALERVVFASARPRTVVVTTPNVEYNVRFPSLEPGQMRHGDHRFEWTRAEFGAWTARVGEQFGYTVRLLPIGIEDTEVGAPTQMAVFERWN